MQKSPLLHIENLKISFKKRGGKTNIVNGISFSLHEGETLGIVGESGCGKSVTGLSILSLLGKNAEKEGSILFQDENLINATEREMRKIRGNQISMIFQEPMTSLNPLHTVGKQIGEPMVRYSSLSKQQRKDKVIMLLKEVGISRPDEIYYAYPHELSGGMRQRVMIAIAIALNPKIIIADEPTTALDVTIQAQIIQLMRTISSTYGTSFMLITHDLGVVAEMCNRVIVMYAGEIVEEADVQSLFASPKHPYTIGLIHSIPSVSETKERLEPIPGTVPQPGEMPEGCRFAPRCSHVTDQCRISPSFIQVGDDHKCRCWLYEEKEVKA